MACTCQTWLAGRVDQEAHAEEDIHQTAELDAAGSRQSQGSRPGRRVLPEKHRESPVLNGSSPGPAKPAASATAPPQEPASKLPAACGSAYAILCCPNGPQPGPHPLSSTWQNELMQHT